MDFDDYDEPYIYGPSVISVEARPSKEAGGIVPAVVVTLGDDVRLNDVSFCGGYVQGEKGERWALIRGKEE
jgi:hypothetical protein